MVTRTPKKKRGHKFTPAPASEGSTGKFRFCSTCSRMRHYRLHQPLWWRIFHKELYRN